MRTSIVRAAAGYVRVEVRGMYARRVLDACARESLGISDIEAAGPQRLRFSVPLTGFPELRPIVRKNACRLHIVSRGGLPFWLRSMRERAGFFIGAALCVAVFWCLTSYIWTIEVVGNETLSSAQILRALEPYGVVRGAAIASVHNESVRNGVLCDLPELSFLTVRFEGSHAVVEVRERRVPPEVADDGAYCDIVAAEAGLVTMVRARQGTAAVTENMLVEKGDLLVAGEMRYRLHPGGYRAYEEYGVFPVRADADVLARVWKTARAAAPLETFEKIGTGRKKVRWALVFGARRVNLYFSTDIFESGCDIITARRNFEPLSGVRLPVTLVRETCTYYDRIASVSDEAALTESLKEEALRMLEEMTAGARLTVNNIRTAVLHGTVYATATGETVQNIAVSRPKT
ncbi:MAG: sporulation protein YqfD [Eubacteriales bacterium]|nr:sporulation protein YqfD [Eubacteriales bacterium]